MAQERFKGGAITLKIDPEAIILGLLTSGIPPRWFIRRSYYEGLLEVQTDPVKKEWLSKRINKIDDKIADKLM